MGVGAKRNPST